MEGHGAVRSQISSLAQQARAREIAASKISYISIYDELGAMGNAFQYILVF